MCTKTDGIAPRYLWCWVRLTVGGTPDLGLEG